MSQKISTKVPKSIDKRIDETNSCFEVLNFSFGKATNVVSWKDSAFTYCSRQVGAVARVIKESKLYRPPIVIRPTDINAFDEEHDPFGDLKKDFLHAISERRKLLSELPDKEFKLFNHLWGNCSKESQDQIIRLRQQSLNSEGGLVFIKHNGEICNVDDLGAHPKIEVWDEIQVSGDVLSLMRRINTSHLSPDDGSDAEKRYNTIKRHESLKMYPSESLLDFKRRFDHSLEAFSSVGLDLPNEEVLVFRFMDALDDGRFNIFKVERFNWSRTVPPMAPLPSSVSEAFHAASTHRSVTSGYATNSATAFYATKSVKKCQEKKKSNAPAKDHARVSSNNADKAPSTKKSVPSVNSKPKAVPTRPCKFCSEQHWDSDCPLILSAKKDVDENNKSVKRNIHVAFSKTNLNILGNVISTVIDFDPIIIKNLNNSENSVILTSNNSNSIDLSRCILLDNQASSSVFKDVHLLSNLRSCIPCRISGIDADDESFILANEQGDFDGIKNIYASTQASANIISFSETVKYCLNSYDQETNTFNLTTSSGKSYDFIPYEGHYIFQFDSASSLVTSVSDNKLRFSQREIKDATGVRDLSRSLAYPSQASLTEMLTSGAIINCPFSATNVAHANAIFGPDLGAVRGKTRRHKSLSPTISYIPRETRSNLILHLDVMFVGGFSFLISVSTPIGLTAVNELGRSKGARASAPILKAIFSQLDLYKSRGFSISHILTDNEGGVIASSSQLEARGVLVNPVGPGAHVPVVERKIQEVKERCRSIISTLPYRLPLHLFGYLVIFVISRINMVPHRAGYENVAPFEAFTGRKIDFKIDLRISFGEYAEVFNIKSDNSMAPRTSAAICLGPTGNISGSVKFLSLVSNKIIIRDQFTVLPSTDIIINAMNQLEASTSSLLQGSVMDFLGGVTGEDTSSTTISAYDDLTHLPSFDEDPLHTPLPYDPATANDMLAIETHALGI